MSITILIGINSTNKIILIEWTKDINNTDVVAHKLKPALIKITRYMWKIDKNKKEKREKMVKKKKLKAMIAKYPKKEISLSDKKKEIMRVTLKIKQI